MRARIRRRGTA
ncbi:hypothetical protein ECEC1864_3243, partial [Escherichia coli EC1864]